MGYTFSWEFWLLISWLLFPTKARAERGLTDSEIILIVCGLILALGAIGEYLEEHGRLPRLLRWPKLVFIIMVVVGLLGEFFGDAGVFVFSSKLQEIEGAEIQALDKKAREALSKVEKAISKSDTATRQAGEATTKAELAESVSGRALTLARGVRTEADAFKQDIASAKQEILRQRWRSALLIGRLRNDARLRRFQGQHVDVWLSRIG